MSVAETLRGVPLFAQLHDDDLQQIVGKVRKRTYPKGSVIVFEDDPGDALFIIADGQVKVVLVGEDGREVILATLAATEFFGEMSLIDDEPRSAHVIAVSDAEVLILRREEFQEILHSTPRIAVSLLGALCARLRSADKKIGGLALLDVSGRVARLLLELADENDGTQLANKVTHHTIGQMIGSSRETVSRTMSNMVVQGMIEVRKTTIIIKDKAALKAAAGQG